MIYIDSDFKCQTTNPGNTYAPVETTAFDGKCDTYIEGYRFIPAGQTWTRADGVIFAGEMIAPWKSWAELDAVQREYEREQYQTVAAQIKELDEAYKKGVDSL